MPARIVHSVPADNENKPSFTNDDSLRRMLYLASQRIVKHWHARCQNWDLILSQLEIMFADRSAGGIRRNTKKPAAKRLRGFEQQTRRSLPSACGQVGFDHSARLWFWKVAA